MKQNTITFDCGHSEKTESRTGLHYRESGLCVRCAALTLKGFAPVKARK